MRKAGLFLTCSHWIVAMGATALLASTAQAQSQSQPQPVQDGAATPPANGGLEDIIVTARKRNENVQNIPVAVTALSQAQLTNGNIRTIEQVAVSTPQLIVARGTSGSGANLSLRGIGSNFTSIGIEQSVSVNVDGVYFGQGRILNEALFDMQGVEILKGPQALFFGKNATAGALSFTTASPGKNREIIMRAGYEFRTAEKYVEGIFSTPVTDTLGFRLAARYSNQARGWVRNQGQAGTFLVNDAAKGGAITSYDVPAPDAYGPMEENVNLRATLAWEPSDKLKVILKGSFANRTAGAAGYLDEFFACPLGSAQLAPTNECRKDWRVNWVDLPAAVANSNPLLGKHGGRGYDDYRSYTATGTLNYTTSDVMINWVNGYQQFTDQYMVKSDTTDNYNRGTYVGTRTSYEAYSTELRAQTTLNFPLNFLAGLYYQNSSLFFQQDIMFPGTAAAGHRIDSSVTDPTLQNINLRKIGNTDGNTFAAFGQVQWDIVPRLQATAGARFTHETKDSTFVQPYISANLRTVYRMYDPTNPASFISNHQTFNNFAPEFTLTYKPTSDLTLYGAYKTGYKSGGFSISALNTTTTDPKNFAFNPETVKGGEVGIRSKLFDNHLRLNLTAFSYTYKNLQVDFFNSQITSYVTFNAGSARTRGVELEAEYAPPFARGFLFHGSLAYDNAIYTSFPGAPCYAGQTPAQGCLAPTATINYVHQNLGGTRTGLAPTWAGSLQTDYDTDISATLKLGISANVRYSSHYLISPFGNPIDRQDGYGNIDASVRLSTRDDRWELAVIGKNLTNHYVLNAAIDTPSTGSGTGTAAGVPADQYGLPSPPRTVALQLTTKF